MNYKLWLFLLLIPTVYADFTIDFTVKPAIESDIIASVVNPYSEAQTYVSGGFLYCPLTLEEGEAEADIAEQIIYYKDKERINITAIQDMLDQPKFKRFFMLAGLVVICMLIILVILAKKDDKKEDFFSS